MTTPLPVGPLTPYISPELLIQAPTGVDFFSIPPASPAMGVLPSANMAEISNICARATDLVDLCVRQPLRATTDTLQLYGPGAPRVYVPRGGRIAQPAKLVMTRWPVLEVVSVQYSPNSLPYTWSAVPAGLAVPASPVTGMYGSSAPASAGEGGQGINVAAGYIDWRYGQEGFAILSRYVNGWPHAGLTSAATAGAQSVDVDDCTGWVITAPYPGAATGATGIVYDAAAQEVVQVTAASAQSGPGTLTLSAPLRYQHDAGVIVSSLPQAAGWAAILFACEIALERGATAMTMMEIPGREVAARAGVDTSYGSPACWAEKILEPFTRII
ncbi:MAG TPA: hypothetical protein VFB06_11385 [Streptosporangiaceae bacterium]|nr:hypothetical protein [Streptosporangiaceae bacterium]